MTHAHPPASRRPRPWRWWSRARWRARSSRSRVGDGGAATLLVVGLVASLLAVTMGGLLVAGAVVASHRARLAADLAVIAGAAALRDGAPVDRACAAAQRVAAMNGARLVTCRADGLVLEVGAAVAGPAWFEPARARSRAGPEWGIRSM